MQLILVTFLAALIATAAFAQVDPRIATQTVEALQAMLNLRDAQMKALQEDHKKKVDELKEACGEPCKDK